MRGQLLLGTSSLCTVIPGNKEHVIIHSFMGNLHMKTAKEIRKYMYA